MIIELIPAIRISLSHQNWIGKGKKKVILGNDVTKIKRKTSESIGLFLIKKKRKKNLGDSPRNVFSFIA